MQASLEQIWKSKIWLDCHGQDLVDYALLAGFLAVIAGAISPVVANSFSQIIQKLSAAMTSSSTQGAR